MTLKILGSKKDEIKCFDVAEICELVGLYILSQLSNFINKKEIGLYRDDGLEAVDNSNGPKLDKLKKKIIALFKTDGFNISTETNLTTTDFLDVTFDLKTGKYYHLRKPNDTPKYNNACSNHVPSIVKQLPQIVYKRISDISCDQPKFDKAKAIYKSALKSSG